MQTKEDIIYFEIDNWFSGRDYPNDEIFRNGLQRINSQTTNGAKTTNYAS